MDSNHSRWNRTSCCGIVFHVSVGLLLSGAILYFWNQARFKGCLDWVFVKSYMNDCLAGITLVSYANLLCLGAKRAAFCLTSPLLIGCFMLTVGLFWEFVTPLYHPDSVCDPLDLVAYVGGGMIYWAAMKAAEYVYSHGRETLLGFAQQFPRKRCIKIH
jgi:hypothetical protein